LSAHGTLSDVFPSIKNSTERCKTKEALYDVKDVKRCKTTEALSFPMHFQFQDVSL